MTRVLPHELAHVKQWERLGTLMFLAYPLASLWALLCGRHYYLDNYFELEAEKAKPDPQAIDDGWG
jgi:hypothetical protein